VRSTILKYLLKNWLWPFVGALVFYGGLLMAYEVVGVTKQIFSMGAPFRWVVPLLMLSVPENLGMVLPMAAVLGGLMGMQHLSEGSEMVAAQGLGVGMKALVKPWLILATGLLVVASFNAHVVVPWANVTQRRAQTRMIEEARTRFLRPGSPPWFPPSSPGDAVWMAPDGQVHLMGVSPDAVQHLVARSLSWSPGDKGEENTNIKLKLMDLKGAVYHRTDGSIVHMQEKEHGYTIQVPLVPKLLYPTEARFQGTIHLLTHPRMEASVELIRRFTLPLASCALLLLGIALGLGHPRFQHGGAIVKSLGVILIYYLILKYFENQILYAKSQLLFPRLALLLLPWMFLLAGFALLKRKLMPHHSNRLRRFLPTHTVLRLEETGQKVSNVCLGFLSKPMQKIVMALKSMQARRARRGVLSAWSRALWWKNWGAVMGTFLSLSLLIEYAGLAGDLAHNHISNLVFLRYWIWNLPPFLSVVMPLAFLLGGVLAFSDAAISREWVALRAGGASLVQWTKAAFRGWGAVVVFTFLLQAFLAPFAYRQADPIYRHIIGRPPRASLKSKPWLYLGSTGVVWFLDGAQRWGFPLKSPGEAYLILKWGMGDTLSEALPWGGLAFEEGPRASLLFPDKALRESATAEGSPTRDLAQWQKWAPDPERATMLWGRLLNWLAGPCLLFAMLPYAFPSPRGGRGSALGFSLVGGLVFMGMQALFSGAAKAGDLPSAWGVLCPLLLLVGFGLLRMNRLRT
jgi:lipopolysaccharide export LptBFGC system permease protein LptF